MSEVIEVIKKCIQCGKISVITLDKEKFMRWQNGELIQRVFPEMSAEDREVLISGTHPKCWKQLWEGEDDGA